MNMQEARREYSIPQWRYSEEYISATRRYMNAVRNFENAVARLSKRGKINRRRSPQRTRASAQSSEEISAEV